MKKLFRRLLGIDLAERNISRRKRAEVAPDTGSAPDGDERAIILSSVVKQSGVTLPAGKPISLRPAIAIEFFLKAGWAVETDSPAEEVFDVSIDANAVLPNGRKVMEA